MYATALLPAMILSCRRGSLVRISAGSLLREHTVALDAASCGLCIGHGVWVPAGLGDRDVRECGDDGTYQRAGAVDPEFPPGDRATEDARRDVRAERAGGVDGASADRPDDHDLARDCEPDDKPAEPHGSAPVDRESHDRGHQQERPEAFCDDGL